ncbi:MAG: preprotein translocase subunit SecY [Deltaproteobacteria bacterium]|nr:preprotein translocase subunit SecY [Deltaproteobacteria bacterium]
MLGNLQNIFKVPELKRRILFTLGFLAIYRVGCHVPIPGINARALEEFFQAQQGGILGLVSMFSGGALRRMTVFALGIMPYISASIILQLLQAVIPSLDELAKEGAVGRKKITQYTRYGTIILSLVQGAGIAIGLQGTTSPSGAPLVPHPGSTFLIFTVITLVAGTSFIMWLGEQITERGIGNGISLIIFAGIVAAMPSAVALTVNMVRGGIMQPYVVMVILVVAVSVIGAIIFMENGFRKVPVQYAKRMVGRKAYGGSSTHIPLKINTAGVIPPIFASSIILFPATIARMVDYPWAQAVAASMRPGSIFYNIIYVGFIIFFCFFYTAIMFNPVDVADNMKKQGGFIPGIRPGKNTSDYLDRVLSRVTFIGAIYLSAVCVLPMFLIQKLNIPFYFGGTSLLIVVGVALDTLRQVESHLLQRHYDGFLKTGRLRDRRGH